MMQLTEIKCPRCKKMVSHLRAWKEVENIYFHLCEKCCKSVISVDDYLLIGFKHGYWKAIEAMRELLKSGEEVGK